jgi:glycosyltransferase involved in cell wall biosynthesis
MKLCIDVGPTVNSHRVRGIGYCTRALVSAIDPQFAKGNGIEVTYLTPSGDPGEPLDNRHIARRSWTARFTGVGTRLPEPLADRWKAIEAAIRLPHDVRATRADVFLATDPQAVPRSPAFKTVAILYDLIPLRFPSTYLPWWNVVARLDTAFTTARIQQADHLVAISEATKQDALQFLRIAPDRISVVPLAVDRSIFREIPEDRARTHVLRRFGINRRYLLYVGGFDYRKNVPALISAFQRTAARHDLDLVVVGPMKGPGHRLAARVRSGNHAERITWLGHVPLEDLPYLYAGAVAFVYPSLAEGFGLPVLEAMSCGTPVLTSNVSALPEVAGDAAVYANPTSVSDLADKIQRLIDDDGLRGRLSGMALSQARKFSWRSTAERILSVCGAVHGGDPGTA